MPRIGWGFLDAGAKDARASLLPGKSRPSDDLSAATPAQKFQRIAALLPVFGITRIADVTGLDRVGLPVVAVYRPNSRSAVVTHGKGIELVAARLSGVMEAIELYHAGRVMLPLKLGSIAELSPSHNLADLASFLDNEGSTFAPSTRLLWVEGFDLLADTRTWLPLELVHLDRTVPCPGSSGQFSASSTGLAAGFSMAEALSHALCEIIERDAVARWFATGAEVQAATRLDPETVGGGEGQAILAMIQAAGLRVAVWDGTSDIAVPVAICNVVEECADSLPPAASAWGMAAHPDRDVALRKSLAEALQARLAMICAVSDDIDDTDFSPAHDAILKRQIQIVAEGRGHRSHRAMPSHNPNGPVEEVNWLLEQLKAAGLSHAIMVDLTHPEFRIPVLRVVVPGMAHISAETPIRIRPRARRIMGQKQ